MYASLLENAIAFALRAHNGQTHDHLGTPYILHPLRVMERVRAAGHGEDAQIVAVLHDTIEDTGATYTTLFNLTGKTCIAQAVDVLSRKRPESYEEFIQRIIDHPLRHLTVPVKLGDIFDNIALGQKHPLPEPRRSKLLNRYSNALKNLASMQIKIS